MAKRAARLPKPYKPRSRARPASGHYLLEWRLYRGFTQQKAADESGLSVASISQMETGDQGFSCQSLAALANAYNCDICDLFRDPRKADYRLWRLLTGLPDELQKRALKVIQALTE